MLNMTQFSCLGLQGMRGDSESRTATDTTPLPLFSLPIPCRSYSGSYRCSEMQLHLSLDQARISATGLHFCQRFFIARRSHSWCLLDSRPCRSFVALGTRIGLRKSSSHSLYFCEHVFLLLCQLFVKIFKLKSKE